MHDRAEAIAFAIGLAHRGDMVITCGKAHEILHVLRHRRDALGRVRGCEGRPGAAWSVMSTRQQQREQLRQQQPKSGPPTCLIMLLGLLALLICAVAAGFLIVPMLRNANINLPFLRADATQTPSATQPVVGAKLVVHVIDVGQGDSILLLGPGGSTMLIDGGEKNSGSLTYLKAHNIERINMMVATHTDADHIGGLVDILAALPVDEVVATGATANTKTYEQLLDGIATSKAKYTEVHRGDKLALDGMSFLVLNPGVDDKIKDANDSSIVLRTEYGPTSFMFNRRRRKAGREQDHRVGAAHAGDHTQGGAPRQQYLSPRPHSCRPSSRR